MNYRYDLSYISAHNPMLGDFFTDLIKLSGGYSQRVKDVITEIDCLLKTLEKTFKSCDKIEMPVDVPMQGSLSKIYISQKEAAFRYGYSKQWFERKRWSGGGPSFLKIGTKVLYNLIETDAWFANHGTKNSTSEYINES